MARSTAESEATDAEADLYRPVGLVGPLPSLEAIDDDAVDLYREQGFLAVRSFLHADRVAAACAAIADIVADAEHTEAHVQAETARGDSFLELRGEARLDAVRKLMRFAAVDERLGSIASDPALVSTVERLMGAAPVLFQDMALLKPPGIGTEKPWHQDHAYFPVPVDHRIVGCWIALDEATRENGCMHVVPRGHRDGPRIHYQRRDWQICDSETRGIPSLAVPLPPGGLLLFDSLLPHGTPTNRSSRRRRALQYHYAPNDAPRVDQEERLRLFGSEGKDVEC